MSSTTMEPRSVPDHQRKLGVPMQEKVTIIGSLIVAVADFLQKSAAIYEQHGEELRSLVLQGRQQVDKLKQDG